MHRVAFKLTAIKENTDREYERKLERNRRPKCNELPRRYSFKN